MKYRKLPVVVEATQWHKNGDHPLDYSTDHKGFDGGRIRTFTAAERKEREWEGEIVRFFRRPDVPSDTPCEHCGKTMHVHGWIDTKEGGHIVCPGDWIITGVAGENYPCKPDIFAKTYEAGFIPELEIQQIIDVGLNAFGLQLFAESVAGKTDAKTFQPFFFKFRNIKITLQPDGEVDTRHH